MSNSDPTKPFSEPGSSNSPPSRMSTSDEGMDTGMMVGAAVAVALIFGIIFYVVSGPSTNTASNPLPSTTGQGGTLVNPPIAPSIIPTPTPPMTAPPIDKSVPPEKFAPPVPTEPRIDN